jgi:hypothetical protein
VLLSGSLLLAGLLTGSQAQVQTAITTDGTLGTTVTQTGTVYIIREFQPNSGGVFTGSLR